MKTSIISLEEAVLQIERNLYRAIAKYESGPQSACHGFYDNLDRTFYKQVVESFNKCSRSDLSLIAKLAH